MTKVDFGINLATAKAIGLRSAMPTWRLRRRSSLVAPADEVIE